MGFVENLLVELFLRNEILPRLSFNQHPDLLALAKVLVQNFDGGHRKQELIRDDCLVLEHGVCLGLSELVHGVCR